MWQHRRSYTIQEVVALHYLFVFFHHSKIFYGANASMWGALY